MPRGASLAAAGVAAAALLAAGCGGGSRSPSIASVDTTTSTGGTSTAESGTDSDSPPNQTQLQRDLLRYAACMRAHGVPNFPDPSSNGGFALPAGADPASPAFQAAQAACRKLMPGGGPSAPGSQTHPSAQALAQMVKIADCMRRHGVPAFPEPRTSVPSGPPAGGSGVMSDHDGVILVFPAALDMQSPAFLRAAAACGFRLTNH